MTGSAEVPTEASDAAWTTLTQLGHFVPGDAVDAALVAARPYLMPEVVVDHRPGETCSVAAEVDPETGFARPILDRDAVRWAIADELDGEGVVSYGLAPKLTDRVMDLARPMPTEVEIAEHVRRIFMEGGAARTHAQEAAAEIAHAMLALLTERPR